MWLTVLLICVTPFVAGAVILWTAERRKRVWVNDPFAFLRDAGFAPPVRTWTGRELESRYSKGDIDVITAWDGAATVRLQVRTGAHVTTLGDLPADQAAALLRARPELWDRAVRTAIADSSADTH